MIQTDILVIGGGATGGGITWDAALRGARVILAEMGDLATGTSGRYHGLLHSGGRYAVRDPESAKECIDENRIVRKIAPQSIEDTGGYFVLCPEDDEAFVDQWVQACAAVNIPTRRVPLEEARKREHVLNPAIKTVYEVPDGTCDSWDLLHALQAGAEQTGRAQFLTYHRVEAFHKAGDRVVGARLRSLRNDELIDVTAGVVINAAGPWAAEVAALAGAHFGMKLSRGAMLAYNIRWVNTVINKLRMPGDGDIFVPVGTVSVIGTTSVTTDDPGDTRVESWEITRILDEMESMTPGISRARILRAWGGVRPLYDPGGDGRAAKRTFTVLDHGESGVPGLISILGGKLTTFRLMAEKAVDAAANYVSLSAPCTTATTVLPPVHGAKTQHIHQLRDRLDTYEHRHGEDDPPRGDMICECEIVTRGQIEHALKHGDVVELNDLRRDLRVGMGPCQGGFCAYRAAAIRHEVVNDMPDHTRLLLAQFAERRFGGMKPLLWGHNLRQVLLAEHLYGRVLGMMDAPLTPQPKTGVVGATRRVAPPPPNHTNESSPRIVVIGAGLAGLTAALTALESGARVEVIANGQGALTLHPGWIEIGDVDVLAAKPDHPYAHAGKSLADGLAVLDRVVGGLHPVPHRRVLTAGGTFRHAAYTVGHPYPDIDGKKLLIVGIHRWRDFYARLMADTLRGQGIDADALDITMPDFGGNFDNWTVDLAEYLDSDAGLADLTKQVKSKLGSAQIAAFPAVLGLKLETRALISQALGVAILEIPTLTPSVPGLRLYHNLRRAVLALGGRFTVGTRVTGLERDGSQITGVIAETVAHGRTRTIPADAVILATGGLFGGGLDSDYKGRVWETVANLPVSAIPPMTEWFAQPLLAGEPQPIHAVGVRVDGDLRPVDANGDVIAPNLAAAGRILGGYSPVIEASTEGVDVASGARAAQVALASVGEGAKQK